ncbi:MAG: MFS transporter [Chloroflexi bacterium]|nr:MFS transporter [Chloroflexota bacterium]
MSFSRNVWLLFAQNLAVFVGIGVQALTLNLYLVALGHREDFLGLVAFANTLAIGAAALPASASSNRYGARRCLIAATAGLAVGGVVAVTGTSPVAIVAAMLTIGACQAFIFVPMAPYLMENASPGDHPRAFAVSFAVLSLGTVLGSTVGGLLPGLVSASADPGAAGYRAALLLGAAMSGLGSIAMLAATDRPPEDLTPCTPSPFTKRGPVGEVGIPSPTTERGPGGEVGTPSPLSERGPGGAVSAPSTVTEREPGGEVGTPSPSIGRQVGGEGRPSLRRGEGGQGDGATAPLVVTTPSVLRRELIAMAATAGLLAASTGLVVPFFNVYLHEQTGASSQAVGAVYAVGAAAMAPVSLIGPAIGARLGTVRLIALARLAAVPATLLPLLAASFSAGAAAYVLRVALVSLTQPLDSAFTLSRVPDYLRARVAAIRTLSWNAAWAVASAGAGATIVRWGYAPVFIVAAICLLGCVVVHYAAFGRSSPPEVPGVAAPTATAQ